MGGVKVRKVLSVKSKKLGRGRISFKCPVCGGFVDIRNEDFKKFEERLYLDYVCYCGTAVRVE